MRVCHIAFNGTNDNLACSSLFDGFRLSEYIDDEDKELWMVVITGVLQVMCVPKSNLG